MFHTLVTQALFLIPLNLQQGSGATLHTHSIDLVDGRLGQDGDVLVTQDGAM